MIDIFSVTFLLSVNNLRMVNTHLGTFLSPASLFKQLIRPKEN